MNKPSGKNIKVAIGSSDLKDAYEASMEAAKKAVNKLSENPTFSLIFFSSNYDAEKVNKGLSRILGTENWAAVSSDGEISSEVGYASNSIQVLSIASKYLHFSVAVAENYREDAEEKGKIAITQATENIHSDRLTDPYIQFSRHTKKSYADIIKNPPYFTLLFIDGQRYEKGVPVPGKETEFLNGITNAIGTHVPIFGASASSDFVKLSQNIAESWQIVNGKVYSKAAVVIFAVSDLYFSYGLEHGYKATPRIELLSQLAGDGRIITKLNDNEAVSEYCKILGIKKEDFLKNPWQYTFTNPFATLDSDGEIYLRTIAVTPDGNSFATIPRLVENSFVDIAQYDDSNVKSALRDSVRQANRDHKGEKMGVILAFECSSRKAILGENLPESLKLLKKDVGDTPFFGFFTFGEIGSKWGRSVQFNNQTVTSLVIYDKLLTE